MYCLVWCMFMYDEMLYGIAPFLHFKFYFPRCRFDFRLVVQGSSWKESADMKAKRFKHTTRRKGPSVCAGERKQIRFVGLPASCTPDEASRVRDAILLQLSGGTYNARHLNDAKRALDDHARGWLAENRYVVLRDCVLLALTMDMIISYNVVYDVFVVDGAVLNTWSSVASQTTANKWAQKRKGWVQPKRNVGRVKSKRADNPLRVVRPGYGLQARRFILRGGGTPRRAEADEFRDCFRSQQGSYVASGLRSLLSSKCNVLIQGCAGTGKSRLIRTQLTPWLCDAHGVPLHDVESRILVTSSTGLSAMAINGRTLHSVMGIGRGALPVAELVQVMSVDAKARVRGAAAIIVDEGSMISHVVVDVIDGVLRVLRNTDLPWGGLQVIFVSDFLQLGPIGEWYESGRPGARLHCGKLYDRRPTPWAFFASCWNSLNFEPCLLMTNFRHGDDPEWVTFLDMIARGDVHGGNFEALRLKLLALEVPADTDGPATHLFSTRNQVADHEVVHLEALPGPSRKYRGLDAVDDGYVLQAPTPDVLPAPDAYGPTDASELFPSMTAARTLDMKMGARVLLIQNYHSGHGTFGELVNGSIGTVVGFVERRDVSCVSWLMEIFPAQRSEFVDRVLNHVSGGSYMFPQIKFDDEQVVVMVPSRFTLQTEDGSTLGVRYQIPLLFAYSLTVTKAQGMTLSKVVADCSRIFATGQFYVACSRTRSANDLRLVKAPELRRLENDGLLVDVKALQFLHGLSWRRVYL